MLALVAVLLYAAWGAMVLNSEKQANAGQSVVATRQ